MENTQIDNAAHPEPALQDPDPTNAAPGSHLVGTGIGVAAGGLVGGAIAGAAIGTAVGPIGTAIGAAIGAIAGGLAGNAVAESVNPTSENEGVTAEHAGIGANHRRLHETSVTEESVTTAVTANHETIATRAYYIWEGKGRSDGHALDDWLQAESLVLTGI